MPRQLSEDQDRERKVKARMRFLVKVKNFVINLARDHGRRVSYNQGSCHTHEVRKLENFAGFDFETDLGHSMMGGNDFTVWRHIGEHPYPVLKVYWQVDFEKECKVLNFVEDEPWQQDLLKLIRNQKRVLARMAQKQKRAEEQKKKNKTDQAHHEQLLETAKRLAIAN